MSIFRVVEQRASPENPSTSLANPASWFMDLFAGATHAGVNVNEKTALRYSAVWNAITIYSNAFASLPVKVFQRDSDGNKQEVQSHPATRLVGKSPNDLMTGATFKQHGGAHLVSWGNWYSAIARDGRGAPKELILLTPDKTKPVMNNGRLHYETELNDGTRMKIEVADMIHVPGLGFDGVEGYSVIKHARNSIGISMAAEKFGGKFFDNGANMSGVLKQDAQSPGFKSKDDKEDWLRSWRQAYTGTDNALKTALLKPGMSYERIGIPPEDAQFLETREFGIRDVARWFDLPPHMLKSLESQPRSNIEQQAIEYVIHSLRPWLVKIEQELEKKLLTEQQKRSGQWQIKFNVNALLRGDSEAQSEFIDKMIKNGVYSINDGRRFLDLNTVENGDRHFVQQNLMPLDRTDEVIDQQNNSTPNE